MTTYPLQQLVTRVRGSATREPIEVWLDVEEGEGRATDDGKRDEKRNERCGDTERGVGSMGKAWDNGLVSHQPVNS